ncbi:MAG: NAD(P)H-dependent oxidoreductase [Aureispira sp.]
MNILIINGNPKEGSYSDALVEAYQEGATAAGNTIEVLDLRGLNFDLSLQFGYNKTMKLEADLEKAIQKMQWCDHMVWIYPLWWSGYPALMKGFIDRTFLPGIAYKYHGNEYFPEQLFKGKTARIICTADSPSWFNYWALGNPSTKQLKKATLGFCGVKPVRTTFIGPIRNSTLAFREKWLQKVTAIGRNLS